MHITTHTDYSLRLLIFLYVHQGQPISIRQIANCYGISSNHLAKVVQTLVAAGWVDSVRGRSGGVSLNPKVHEVTLGEIFRYTESNQQVVECFGKNSNCAIEPACGLKSILRRATDAFIAELDKFHLKDMAPSRKSLQKLLDVESP